MSKAFVAHDLVGSGAAGALDAIDGATLGDQDIALVVADATGFEPFVLDADSGATPDGVNIIAPYTSPGTKRWIKKYSSINPDLLYSPFEVDALDYNSGAFTKATIDAALTAIGTTDPTTLLIRPGTWVIGANTDWSAYSNVTFLIPPGAVFSHGGYTMIFPPNAIIEGDQARFTGTTSYTKITGLRVVRPGWFGLGGSYSIVRDTQLRVGAQADINISGRADAQIEAQNNAGTGHALISIFNTENPGSITEEAAISYQAYSAEGNIKQMASISAMWCNNASEANGLAVLRLNIDKADGYSDIAYRQWPAVGVTFFGEDETDYPGCRTVMIRRATGGPSLIGADSLVLEGSWDATPGDADGEVFINAYSSGDIILAVGGGDVRIPQFEVAPAVGSVTVESLGAVNRLRYKVTTPYTTWLVGGAQTADLVICTLPARAKIVSFYAHTTTQYLGGTISAASMKVGTTTNGTEILAEHDVFTAAILSGGADADMGSSMTRAAMVQGGYIPSWSGTTDVLVRLGTSSGNLDLLTQGETTFYLETEVY